MAEDGTRQVYAVLVWGIIEPVIFGRTKMVDHWRIEFISPDFGEAVEFAKKFGHFPNPSVKPRIIQLIEEMY